MAYTPVKTVTYTADQAGLARCSGCPGYAILVTQEAAHTAWHAANGTDVVVTPPPPPPAKPVVTNLKAVASAKGQVTVSWTNPSPAPMLSVGRDGTEANGTSPNWEGPVAAGTTSQVFTGLSDGTKYNFTVTPTGGTTASVACTTLPATTGGGGQTTPPVTTPPTTGAWDWTSHFGSKAAYLLDFYNHFWWDGSSTGVPDPGSSSSWDAGDKNSSFFPVSFFTDASAPAGEYARFFCDRMKLHPAEAGRSGGFDWIGSFGVSKRGWTQGYIEYAVRFPAAGSGAGMFPAVWFYAQGNKGAQTDNTGGFTANPAPKTASEIDLIEIFGTKTIQWNSGVHAVRDASQPDNASGSNVAKGTTDNGWHTVGLDWNPASSKLDIYFDRKKVGSATAQDAATFLNQEMCFMIDYTVGDKTDWMPHTDSTTPDSLYMDVSYARHFAAKPF